MASFGYHVIRPRRKSELPGRPGQSQAAQAPPSGDLSGDILNGPLAEKAAARLRAQFPLEYRQLLMEEIERAAMERAQTC